MDLKWHGREIEGFVKHRKDGQVTADLTLRIDEHTFYGWVLRWEKDYDSFEAAQEDAIKLALEKLEDNIKEAASGWLLKCREEDARKEIEFQHECVEIEKRKRDVAQWLEGMMNETS